MLNFLYENDNYYHIIQCMLSNSKIISLVGMVLKDDKRTLMRSVSYVVA
ncbi:Uncharacterised protein [Serratia liquefaciens]|nr:Uncharacterised protein [Serratia liquefaciens]